MVCLLLNQATFRGLLIYYSTCQLSVVHMEEGKDINNSVLASYSACNAGMLNIDDVK